VIRALHGAGFAVLERPPGPAALASAAGGQFDLVAWLVDGVTRSQLDALEAVSRAGVALIALLADAHPDAVSLCLGAGADACLQCDADARVVVAWAHAVLRRRGATFDTSAELGLLQVGDLTVDTDRCEVERAGRYVPLTASEFRIVEYMARNAGRVLRPEDILNAVSGPYEYQHREAQEVFKVYARRIRRKLEPCVDEPRYLVTVRGFGYRLEGEGAGQRAGLAVQSA
jgi:DNA-binding response OmpR family regulator